MKEQLLNRFLKYVQIYTPSDEESGTNPSSSCQFDLAHALEEEMKAMGISQVHVSEYCYVYGHIPATPGYEAVPAIGFIAHMDTVYDFCEKPVIPVLHENYNGQDIFLPEGCRTIRVADFPHLKEMKGRTIITSDGTTILGADDKAGIAEILTMAQKLLTEQIPHGKICIAFTPDEEIGSGAGLLDLEDFGAAFAYTADGDLEGGIEYETFNAASASIRFRGVNVHPGSAKDMMVNAASVACAFQSMLPPVECPEKTSGYEGFFHLVKMEGSVEKALLQYIIRDHDRSKFEEKKEKVRSIAQTLNEIWGEGTVSCEISDTYYNMAEILKDHMHIVETAKKAAELAGLTPRVTPVRGGTDGSQLSFRGLPCPNLGTGGEGFHGPYEHISLEGMEKSVELLLHIVQLYAAQDR